MFFQAGLRRRNEEATGLEAVGEIRSRLTIQTIPRDVPRRRLLAFSLVGSRSNSFCNMVLQVTLLLCRLATGDGGQRASEHKAMEGGGDGYQMEFLGRGSDKEDGGREGEKKGRTGRQREHRSMRR